MSGSINEPQGPASPPLTRRELRERERLTETAQQLAPQQLAPQPSGEGDPLAFLFGTSAAPAPAAPAPAAPVPPQRSSAPSKRAKAASQVRRRPMASRLLSLGALLFAGTLVVGMSLPANAFYDPSTAVAEAGAAASDGAENGEPLQSVTVASNVQAVPTVRDTISVLSWAEVLKEKYGTRDFSYTVGSGPIRWPFPFAVPISSGFGDRVAPCRGCSSYHKGLDFTPGEGSAIFAIADGVVILHDDDAYGFGNHVIIQHEINGQKVTSLYAHMQHGSSPLAVGEVVKVGDFVGLVGQTGMATGAHLHFEIMVNGVNVDPFAWLKANAT